MIGPQMNTLKSKEELELQDIFVGELSADVTEEDIRICFSPCGEITYINLFKDSHTGNMRAYAFVNFTSSVAKGFHI